MADGEPKANEQPQLPELPPNHEAVTEGKATIIFSKANKVRTYCRSS